MELDAGVDEEEQVGDAAFIELVRARDWLYDTEHEKHKDTKYKDNTWALIGEAMGWSGSAFIYHYSYYFCDHYYYYNYY